ncbi:MAG: hypothetical protein JNL74_17150 [Fibrobacteres bacterium]|nr:hypothetical protein [Fibrobacterota bacterium]
MLTLDTVDYTTVIFFLLIFIGIGIWFAQLRIDSDTFFSSRHQLPGWLAGISYFMSGYSANTFTSFMAIMVMVGVAPIFSSVAGTISGAVFAYFFAAVWWHRSGVDSVPEYMGKMYGKLGQKFILATNLPALILGDSIRFYISGLLISTVTGIPVWVSMMITSLVLFAYVVTGGLWGAVITDTIQCFLKFLLLVLMVILSIEKAGNISSILAKLPESHFSIFPGGGFSLFQSNTAVESFCLSAFLFTILITGPMSDSTIWACVQRYTAAKNINETKKVPLFYLLFTVPMMLLLAIPAIAASQYMPEIRGDWKLAEMSYIRGAQMLLPHGLLAILVIGILSTNMAVLSSQSVIISQSFSKDIYKAYIRPNASEKSMIIVARATTLTYFVFCTLLAFMVPKIGGIFWANTIIGAIIGPAMGIPVYITLFYRKAPTWGLISSVSIAMIFGGVLSFARQLGLTELDVALWIRGTIPFMIVLIGMLVTGLLFPPKGEEKEKRDHIHFAMRNRTVSGDQIEQKKMDTENIPPVFIPVNAMVGLPILLLGLFMSVTMQISANSDSLAYKCGMGMCVILIVGGLLLVKSNKKNRESYDAAKRIYKGY